MTIINTNPGLPLAAQRANETDAGRALQTSDKRPQWASSLLTEQQAQTQTQTTTASNGGLKIEHKLNVPQDRLNRIVREQVEQTKEAARKNIISIILVGIGLYLILKK